MKIVKISCPEPQYPLDYCNVPLRQTPGGLGIWGDYKFVVNQDIEECDYWVVFDILPETDTCKCAKKNTIFITGEPPQIGAYTDAFLNQFQNIVTCHKDIIRKTTGKTIFQSIQGHVWFVNKTYDELNTFDILNKPKCMSLITTNKFEKRYKSALKLKAHFGDRLDLYGRGLNPIHDKWEALAPYKYSIVLENFRNNDWITEKLFDSYLAQTYPFYYGCPNITDYYEPESYTEIDIDNIEETIDTIECILSNPHHYICSALYLERAKRLTMDAYNMFPLIIRCIDLLKLTDTEPKMEIKLSDKNRFWKDKMMFFKKLRVNQNG